MTVKIAAKDYKPLDSWVPGSFPDGLLLNTKKKILPELFIVPTCRMTGCCLVQRDSLMATRNQINRSSSGQPKKQDVPSNVVKVLVEMQ